MNFLVLADLLYGVRIVLSSLSEKEYYFNHSIARVRHMDLNSVIRELCAEKSRIDRTIATLEKLLAGHNGVVTADDRDPRGRKSMSPEERREVSQRMKRYWAQRQNT